MKAALLRNAERIDQIGEIWSQWDVVTLRDRLNQCEDVTMLIHSPGGSVTDGLAMFSLLQMHAKSYRVETLGIGLVASMASILLQAASKGKRKMAKSSMLMIHNPWAWTMGDADEMRRNADILESFQTVLLDIYVEAVAKSGKKTTREQIEKMMKDETWMTPDEALELGFIDEVVDKMPELEGIDQAQIMTEQYQEMPEQGRARACAKMADLAAINNAVPKSVTNFSNSNSQNQPSMSILKNILAAFGINSKEDAIKALEAEDQAAPPAPVTPPVAQAEPEAETENEDIKALKAEIAALKAQMKTPPAPSAPKSTAPKSNSILSEEEAQALNNTIFAAFPRLRK